MTTESLFRYKQTYYFPKDDHFEKYLNSTITWGNVTLANLLGEGGSVLTVITLQLPGLKCRLPWR